MAKIRGTSIEDAAASLFPRDEVMTHLVRAATSPATTTTTGWAAELAVTAVADFVGSLGTDSAAAKLMNMGLQAGLDGRNKVLLPRRLGLPSSVPFVLEGGAIPVAQRDLTAAELGPAKKLAILTAFSESLAARSAFQAAVEVVLREDTAASLDAALFSATAASSSRPAGLMNGLTPIAGAAGGGFDAVLADVSALVSAVVAAGGGSRVVFFVNPTRLATLAMLTAPGFPYEVIATRALAEDSVVALDPGAFASGFGPEPRIDTSGEAVLHLDDTSPLAIGTVGAPNTVAAPARSLFQTDAVGLRFILDVAWTMRAPQIGYLTGATW
jgi:hypothetical protein